MIFSAYSAMVTTILSTEELLQHYDGFATSKPFPNEPKMMYDAARHIMAIKGKRIRPLLTLHATQLFSSPTKALGAAHAVEVFHNYTLVHDDIMDNAPLRRGIPTVHEKFGNNVAILSGDVMLSFAYQYLTEGNETHIAELLRVFNTTGIQVMEGQQMDMDFETRSNVTEDEYLLMIKYKTSVLLACALQLGAIVGGASKEEQYHLYEFGIHLGLAFQIKDDYLDTFGEADKVGKKIGGDIINNKKTFLQITAMNIADENSKQKLQQLWSEKNEEIKVSETISLFEQLGVKEVTESKMASLYEIANNHLIKLNVDTEKRMTLKSFADKVYFREF